MGFQVDLGQEFREPLPLPVEKHFRFWLAGKAMMEFRKPTFAVAAEAVEPIYGEVVAANCLLPQGEGEGKEIQDPTLWME